MFAALDRLEQKRFARAVDFAISRERRFNVGEQAARDGDHVALRGQLQKFIRRRRIHETFLAEARRKQKQEAAGKCQPKATSRYWRGCEPLVRPNKTKAPLQSS